jgi:hypothetical protein
MDEKWEYDVRPIKGDPAQIKPTLNQLGNVGGLARPKPLPYSSGCPAQASLGRGCPVVTDNFFIGK